MVMTVVATFVAVTDIVNVKPQHHRVVFVNRVVAVHRIAPDEITETEEQFNVIVLAEPHDILAASLDCRGRVSVSADDLMFFEVNVDRVLPVKPALEIPRFRRVALHPEANIVTVKELVVNDPLAVSPVELELPALLRGCSRRHVVEMRVGRRIDTGIGDRIGNDTEFEYLVSLAGGHNVIGWSRAVALLETIFEPKDSSGGER